MDRPLKGAYLARLDLDAPNLSGVSEKVRAQIAALQEAPAAVDLYYCSQGTVLKNRSSLKSFGSDALRRRLVHYFLYYRYIAKQLKDLDFVYIRHQGCSLSFLKMLSCIRRRNPTAKIILELPSWPYYSEARSVKERFSNLVDRVTRAWLRRYIDRVLTFSKQDSILGIPTLRTENGVDVDRLPLREPPNAKEVIRLVGVANLSRWHGYDRIISGLVEYRKTSPRKQVLFDVVGSGTELEQLKTQSALGGLSGIVVFHGPATGKKLDAILAGSHVAVSSIGMHRLNVDTTNLKSREYCARGIPFIIGYPDSDFPESLPFVFHAPATDEPVDIAAVVAFHEQLANNSVDARTEMRRYAEENLTWRAKLRPLVEFLCHSEEFEEGKFRLTRRRL